MLSPWKADSLCVSIFFSNIEPQWSSDNRRSSKSSKSCLRESAARMQCCQSSLPACQIRTHKVISLWSYEVWHGKAHLESNSFTETCATTPTLTWIESAPHISVQGNIRIYKDHKAKTLEKYEGFWQSAEFDFWRILLQALRRPSCPGVTTLMLCLQLGNEHI